VRRRLQRRQGPPGDERGRQLPVSGHGHQELQPHVLLHLANSGTAATVNQSSSVSGGDATLILKDNTGTTVYTKSLKQNGTFTTTAGVAGNWTIQLLANNVSGTLNFRVQKL
jgi:hypothetical protein